MKPGRDPSYLRWVRALPCVICGHPGSEAAHTKVLGSGGMGQKPDDLAAIPLCHKCHRGGGDSYHRVGDEAKWAARHGVDLDRVVLRLLLRWRYEQQTPVTEREPWSFRKPLDERAPKGSCRWTTRPTIC